jgi:hypothetical protein
MNPTEPPPVQAEFGGLAVIDDGGPSGGDAVAAARRSVAATTMTTLAAVVVGMTAAAVYREGAFYPLDAFGVAVVAAGIVTYVLLHQRDRWASAASLSTGCLVGWWLIRAVAAGNAGAFLPLGASFIGFLAAFLVIRLLGDADRRRVAMALVAIGAVTAAAGLVGVLWHWHPLAQRDGSHWLVATTLTYPAAAAVVCIVGLLLALGLDLQLPARRAAVCLCLAGLIGTQSHWSLLALAGGALLVPPRRWVEALWPVAMGALAGIVVVATSPGHGSSWIGTVLLAVVVGAATVRPFDPLQRVRLGVAGLALVVVGMGAFLVFSPTYRTVQAANESQTLAWSASTASWRTSVMTGIGPPVITSTHEAVDSYPGFAPDTYLTITADGGLVGAVLLVAAGAAVTVTLRRRTLVGACATGAALAFAVAGAVDFDWQLPALGLLGGCVAGLASAVGGTTPHSRGGTRWARIKPLWRRTGTLWVVGVVALMVAQLTVGFSQSAGGLSRAQSAEPAPSATPGTPGKYILRGPGDATDPYMLEIGARYYLYTSEGTTFLNVPLHIGAQPGHWGKVIDALPKLPAWAEPGLTWAPDVHKVAGGWALYFSSLLRGVTPYTHCIGSAFSSSPSGPFVPSPHPFICQLAHRGSIDARVYVEAGNQLVMLWKSEDNANPTVPGPDQDGLTGIYAQNLSANGRVLLGNPVKIFSPSQQWEGTIVEAPDMVEAWGIYWLFYSGNWYYSTTYGIGVAECQSPFGPCADPDTKPLVGSNRQGAGPGEESLFRQGNSVYLLYNPFRANDPGPVISRPVVMTRLGFTPEGPYLAAP